MFFSLTYIKLYQSGVFTFQQIQLFLGHIHCIEHYLRVFKLILVGNDIERRIGRREPVCPLTFNNIMSKSHCHHCKSVGRCHMRNRIEVKRLGRSADMRIEGIFKPVSYNFLNYHSHFFLLDLIINRLEICSGVF